MSIGVALPGGRFRRILERNTPLPHRKNYQVSTTQDDQEQLEVAVFQGESDRALDNEYLGTLIVEGLPKGPQGSVTFDVAFSLTAEALLTVAAEEHGTGRTIAGRCATAATPDSIRARLGDDFAAERLHTPHATPVIAAAAPADASNNHPPKPAAAAAPPAPSGGFFGWVKRLFGGRGAQPRQ